MVHRLVTDLFKVLPRETVFDQTAGRVRMADDAVNLVEGQPVFHLVLVAFADRPDILFKEADDFAGIPAVVIEHQIQRWFIVRHRNQRFNVIFLEFVEHLIVELQAGLVRLFVIAIRINAAPGDRHAVDLKAHLGHQRDVFFIMMVEITAVPFRIVDLVLRMGQRFLNVPGCDLVMLVKIFDVGIEVRAGRVGN